MRIPKAGEIWINTDWSNDHITVKILECDDLRVYYKMFTRGENYYRENQRTYNEIASFLFMYKLNEKLTEEELIRDIIE